MITLLRLFDGRSDNSGIRMLIRRFRRAQEHVMYCRKLLGRETDCRL